MKSTILLGISFVLTMFLVSACCEAPKPAFAFVPTTVEDSTAILPNKTYAFSTTQKSTWRVTGGGTVNSNGIYTPPTTEFAVVTIVAINQGDTSNKVKRTLFVTPNAAIINAVQKGGHVLSFRHGIATTGTDQTSLPLTITWWTSGSPQLARQLDNPAGIEQMRATGKALKKLRIPISKIITSEFNRCKESAYYMGLSTAETTTHKDLTYFVYDEPNRYTKTMQVIANQTISSSNTLLVTHAGFSGTLPTPAPLADLLQGDAAVFKLQATGTPIFVGKLTTQELVAFQ